MNRNLVLVIAVLALTATGLIQAADDSDAANEGEIGYRFTVGDLTYTVTKIASEGGPAEVGIDFCSYSCVEANIPAEVNGYRVTSVLDRAFSECTSLTSVTIPSSVTSIGERAFYHCTSLESLVIPDGVTCIDDETFWKCTSLTKVTIPSSVTSIGERAFSFCSSLISMTVPDGVTSIGGSSFSECTSLTTVTIPDSVTDIGASAFRSCESLTSVIIPDSVTSINAYTFSECTSLTTVNIPPSVTSIKHYAFNWCESLTSVTIPDGVTSVREHTFSECTSLTSVTIPPSVTSIEGFAFSRCTSLTSVTIPENLEFLYGNSFAGISFFKEDGTVISDPAETKEMCGYTFTGKGDGKLYRQEKITYNTITFDSNGGSQVPPMKLKTGDAIVLPDEPSREGYAFMGWEPTLPEVMPDHDITVKAVWEAVVVEHTIIFDSNGGSPVSPITQETGTTIVSPDAPVMEGYAFMGWEPALPELMPDHDITVKAVWEAVVVEHTIIFDSNGGSQIPPMKLKAGDAIVLPEGPSREGYDFIEWEPTLPEVMPDHDITVKAVWEAVPEPEPMPDPSEDEGEDNIAIYIGAAVAALVIVGAVAFLLVRRTH